MLIISETTLYPIFFQFFVLSTGVYWDRGSESGHRSRAGRDTETKYLSRHDSRLGVASLTSISPTTIFLKKRRRRKRRERRGRERRGRRGRGYYTIPACDDIIDCHDEDWACFTIDGDNGSLTQTAWKFKQRLNAKQLQFTIFCLVIKLEKHVGRYLSK